MILFIYFVMGQNCERRFQLKEDMGGTWLHKKMREAYLYLLVPHKLFCKIKIIPQ